MTRSCLALVIAIALAGCGRLGFEDARGRGIDGGIDVAPGAAVTLVVTSDQYLAEVAGTPVAGATVLVERSGGTERLATDATGTVRFAAAGVIACHVIYKSEIGWRGYTVAAPPAGVTIELGSRRASSPTHDMTFALPPTDSAAAFTVRLPEHCATPGPQSTPSVDLPYEVACEGKKVRLIGYALAPAGSGPDSYLDAGTVTLANGGAITVPGSYLALPVHPLEITNLPASTVTATAEVLSRNDLDLTSLTPTPATAVPQGSSAMLNVEAVPGGNALRVRVSNVLPVAYLSSSERIAPVVAASVAPVIDARPMLPLFDSLTAGGGQSASWTGGGGGTLTIVEGIAAGVQWDLYLDGSATSARVPDLPADLGLTFPDVADVLSVVTLAVPGATAADLLPTIDRRWSLWPHDPVLLPPGGSSISRILARRGPGGP